MNSASSNHPCGLHVLEPLVPEAPGLFEIGKGKNAARLISKRKCCDRRQSLRKETGHGVRSTRTPVMSHKRETIQLQRVREVDRILCQGDCSGESRGVLMQKSGRPRAPQIGDDGSPSFRMKLVGHALPAAGCIGPAVKQQNWWAFARSRLFINDFQQGRTNTVHTAISHSQKLWPTARYLALTSRAPIINSTTVLNSRFRVSSRTPARVT
jgi:hypothetical protein